LDDIQTQPFGLGEHFWGLGAGVQPQFIATFGGNFWENLQQDGWWLINANQVGADRNVRDVWKHRQTLQFDHLGVDRKHLVTLPLERPDSLVAIFREVRRGTDDGYRFHHHIIASLIWFVKRSEGEGKVEQSVTPSQSSSSPNGGRGAAPTRVRVACHDFVLMIL